MIARRPIGHFRVMFCDPQLLVLHAWATVHGLAALCVDAGLSKIGIAPEQLAPLITHLTSRMFDALAKSC